MATRFFVVLILVLLAVAGGDSVSVSPSPSPPSSSATASTTGKFPSSSPALPATTDHVAPAAMSAAAASIDSLGPSQGYPDYEIPVELAPEGVVLVEDAMSISPAVNEALLDDHEGPPKLPRGPPPKPSSSSTVVASTTVAAAAATAAAGLFLL